MLLTANIFQPLIDVFEAVIKFFHNSVGVPWGWSIVLLTITIRLVLVPLTLKQFHSMQAMQRVQPEMKALQAKYKDDKQRQQQEMMKFYKENNVNPLASCLPMAAQLPVLISLFYMLREDLRINICRGVQVTYQHKYALAHKISVAKAAGETTPCGVGHHANFLFISDLTNKAHGLTLIVLVLLYVGTQLASSLLMATPMMDKSQRQLMLVMPLFFVIFVFRFPAGVLVYWITTNSWTMGQQYVFRRRVGSIGRPKVAVAGTGDGTTSGSESTTPPTDQKPPKVSRSNGNGASADPPGGLAGGLGSLLRGRSKEDEKATVNAGTRARTAVPPPSPRKKKKRSGRRR